MQNSQEVQLAAAALARALPDSGRQCAKSGWAIILGTGLSEIAVHLLRNPYTIPFSSIPGMPRPCVDSHGGVFLYGAIDEQPVLIQCGRVHLYEGRSPAEICMGVRAMAQIGYRRLIITNAAGGLNPLFEVGTPMIMTDMINHTGFSPLTGPNCSSWGERFPDMGHPFSNRLISLAQRTALQCGIKMEKGVYIGVHGPEMETAAETRMYRMWGADAIGMSTVLEVIAARHMGMECLGISCLTNKNLPDCMEPAPLEAVVAAARKCSPDLGRLLLNILTAPEY